jgi:hypothetical protein
LLGTRVAFVRSDAEIDALKPDDEVDPPLFLTNYESVREGKIDVTLPLRLGIARRGERCCAPTARRPIRSSCRCSSDVPYRHVATATPSPNRYKELIHYAGFLGVMDTGQALTRFFQRNSEKANDLTLYPHKEAEFWLWLNSWGVFLQKPSDLGFSDEGYDLPPFQVRYHMRSTCDLSPTRARIERSGPPDPRRRARRRRRAPREAQDASARGSPRSRSSLPAADEHFLIWHDLEDERKAIEAAVTAAGQSYSAVSGSQGSTSAKC